MLPTKLKMALKKNLANRHWSQQCCHIISLGNAQEQFQLWADPNTASLLIRYVNQLLIWKYIWIAFEYLLSVLGVSSLFQADRKTTGRRRVAWRTVLTRAVVL